MSTFNSKSIFQFASKSDIIKLVLIVTILYVLLQFIRISMLLNNNDDSAFYAYLWNKLSMPSDWKTFIKQPWSLFTYMFIDGDFWGILGNMIWLWIFGTVIEDLRGPSRIIPIFMMGGIVGAIVMLVFGLLKVSPPQLFTGASVSVMAVAFAAMVFKPQYRFSALFGIGIPIWVFVMIFVGMRLAMVQLHNIPFLFMMIGAAGIGAMYTNVLDGFYERLTQLLKQSGTALDNSNFVLRKKEPQKGREVPFKRINSSPLKIDAILDKINEKGINSLTREERIILDEYSKKDS